MLQGIRMLEGERANASRAAIGKALVTLMQGEEFDSITITQLCQRAEVSRSTFYRCFRDKGEVFGFVVSHQVEDFHHHCLGTPASREGRLDSREVFRVFFAYWSTQRGFVSAVLNGNMYVRFAAEFERALCSHIDIADDGPSSVERGYLAACISSTLMALLSRWGQRGFQETIPQMVRIAELANRIPSLSYELGA